VIGFFTPYPVFLGRWGNFPKFCLKFEDAFILRVVITKRLSIWERENIPSKEGQLGYILMKIMQVSLYPFLRNRGGSVGVTTEWTSACYGLSQNSSRLVCLAVIFFVSVIEIFCHIFMQNAYLWFKFMILATLIV